MKLVLCVVGLLLFGLFWMISTPIFFLNDFCIWADKKLSSVIDTLFEGFDG